YNKLFIRKQKTKWGNCSPSKNISLNWKIILMPDYVKEYIILHELLHTKILNHSQAFWMHLSHKYPSYNLAIDWIKKYGNSL
ncbi:MAG: M48 family metallopeptidase, partial [Nanoarchaeota archaeon]|nr:M48 family metallopeptidase [Nanoarchaeota archaeon]